MTHLRFSSLIVGLLAFAVSAVAAQEVGTVASIEGSAEIGREGAWRAAALGGPVNLGDTVRTATPGRVRIVFQDDSVLNIGDSSELVIDQQVFDPNAGQMQSVIKLLRGKVRALVSEYYERTGASYEIETVTAVSGVRGTEFIVSYDAERGETEVIGINGRVEVNSVLDRARNSVFVTAGEITEVAEGQLPTRRPRLEDQRFRQYLEGLEFIGTGRPESLTANHPVLGGVSVPAPDRAPATVVEVGERTGGNRDVSDLLEQPREVIEAATGDLGVRF